MSCSSDITFYDTCWARDGGSHVAQGAQVAPLYSQRPEGPPGPVCLPPTFWQEHQEAPRTEMKG